MDVNISLTLEREAGLVIDRLKTSNSHKEVKMRLKGFRKGEGGG